jgi:hypothetical protein
MWNTTPSSLFSLKRDAGFAPINSGSIRLGVEAEFQDFAGAWRKHFSLPSVPVLVFAPVSLVRACPSTSIDVNPLLHETVCPERVPEIPIGSLCPVLTACEAHLKYWMGKNSTKLSVETSLDAHNGQ